MGIFTSIISFLSKYENTHNVEDFKLSYRDAWFGGDYKELLYSANGGKNYSTINHWLSPSVLHEYGMMDTLHFDSSKESLSGYRTMFKCYQDVLDYEKKQVERKHNDLEQLKIWKEIRRKRIEDNLK